MARGVTDLPKITLGGSSRAEIWTQVIGLQTLGYSQGVEGGFGEAQAREGFLLGENGSG